MWLSLPPQLCSPSAPQSTCSIMGHPWLSNSPSSHWSSIPWSTHTPGISQPLLSNVDGQVVISMCSQKFGQYWGHSFPFMSWVLGMHHGASWQASGLEVELSWYFLDLQGDLRLRLEILEYLCTSYIMATFLVPKSMGTMTTRTHPIST